MEEKHIEILQFFAFVIGGTVLVFIAYFCIEKLLAYLHKDQRLCSGELVEVEAEIVGSLNATRNIENVEFESMSTGFEMNLSSKFIIFEFPLQDGTIIRNRSKYAMSPKVNIGKMVRIAYNPTDLKEIYLLD
jgi:hypothetical protein